MTVKLTGNFLATARCLIYQDGNAITWTFNPNTNQLTAAYTGAGSAGSHNPTATIGLTAVNGTATTWMTSDSAPALSQAIVPTWTGLHTFSSGITVSGTTTISGHTLTLSANAAVGGTNTGDQSGANPSGSVGLSAVNGTATTFMRSDGAPALSQAIVPTWTGAHTFNATFQVAVSGIEFSVTSTGVGVGTTGADSSFQVIGAGSSGFRVGYSGGATNYYDASAHNFRDTAGNALLNLIAAGGLAYKATTSTGTNVPTIGTNKPGSAVSLTPSTWETVVINGTTYYRPLWV